MSPRNGMLLAALLLLFAGAGVTARGEEGGPQFAVTVTNLTAGTVFTPILVASHRTGTGLFELGEPAGVELEQLAEGGATAPLAQALAPYAGEVKTTSGPLLPGESVTVMVSAMAGYDHVSVAAMLVPTNDGFFAVNGVEGPAGNKSIVVYSPGYDAGTEPNDELCGPGGTVPGPPGLCSGEGINLAQNGEGYVHIHPGIHGVGTIPDPAMHDWRNPVAKIMIRRVP